MHAISNYKAKFIKPYKHILRYFLYFSDEISPFLKTCAKRYSLELLYSQFDISHLYVYMLSNTHTLATCLEAVVF